MSQELNVLRCYSCKMYQVHIVKKARKWRCKLCNAKQSVQQIYFQGSGKDCRLNVQHLNYLKANASLSLHPERDDNNDSFNTTSIPQESGINKATESKWAKYLDSPKRKSPSNAEDSSSDDIHEAEDMTTNENSLWNAVKNDSCNFENIADDGSFESEDVADEAEKLYSTNFNYNPNTEDKCNLQDSSKSSGDHNDAASIFETYNELDEPLDI